ncbi:hypothetical protein RYX36_003074, partial [Vicia faba]
MNRVISSRTHNPTNASIQFLLALITCINARNEFLAMVAEDKPNSTLRHIYLTFPVESTFKDEDVLEYFRDGEKHVMRRKFSFYMRITRACETLQGEG